MPKVRNCFEGQTAYWRRKYKLESVTDPRQPSAVDREVDEYFREQPK